MYDACTMHVKNGDKRTDGKLNSRSRMLGLLSIVSLSLYWLNSQSRFFLLAGKRVNVGILRGPRRPEKVPRNTEQFLEYKTEKCHHRLN